MESQETTSPFSAFASATARPVLPDAVGPAMQIKSFMENLRGFQSAERGVWRFVRGIR